MRRRDGGLLVSFVIAGASVSFAAKDARAEDTSMILSSHRTRYETPQNFLVELRFGAYNPEVDSSPGLNGAQPYKYSFGTDDKGNPKTHFMAGAEFDWQIVRIPMVGTLGAGFSFHYAEMDGPSQDPNNPVPLGSPKPT